MNDACENEHCLFLAEAMTAILQIKYCNDAKLICNRMDS